MAHPAIKDMEPTSISAKNLAALAMPDRCDRCWWLKIKARPLPFQIFPGVFSTIDSFSKRLTHGYIARYKRTPPWLATLGNNIAPVDVPHWSKFCVFENERQRSIRGVPDEMFKLADGSLAIVDYKTAVLTAGQDALMPLYEHQLAVYAVIADRLGYGKASRLLLVYFQPQKEVHDYDLEAAESGGFPAMRFETATVEVDLVVIDAVPKLLREASSLLDQSNPPAGRSGCKDCQRLNQLTDMATEPVYS